jgi:hypothetical protein
MEGGIGTHPPSSQTNGTMARQACGMRNLLISDLVRPPLLSGSRWRAGIVDWGMLKQRTESSAHRAWRIACWRMQFRIGINLGDVIFSFFLLRHGPYIQIFLKYREQIKGWVNKYMIGSEY